MDRDAASGDGWFLQIEQRRIALRDGEFTLGRSRGCGVVLRDPSVSRGHALLCIAGSRATLQDLRSSNGTFVNGKRLEGEVALAPGDRLVLGETELYLYRAAGVAREPTEEERVFCPACGLPVAAEAARCTACGAPLTGQRLPHHSEALALGEVLPVGEVLSAPTGSWDATQARRGATPPLPAYPQLVADPPESPDPPEPIRQLPMSVRELEREAAPPRPVPVPAPPPPPAAPEPPRGLLSRLTDRLRRRDET